MPGLDIIGLRSPEGESGFIIADRSHLVLLSQKDIKRKPLENQIKVEIRAAARRRLG